MDSPFLLSVSIPGANFFASALYTEIQDNKIAPIRRRRGAALQWRAFSTDRAGRRDIGISLCDMPIRDGGERMVSACPLSRLLQSFIKTCSTIPQDSVCPFFR